jgi:GNAT superfamily N-acetyltransferase
MVSIEAVRGADALPHLDALARLRIEVFREYPYLYEGTLEYEQRYLASYARHASSVVVIARDGGEVVGASTALPLLDHGEDVAPVFEQAEIDPRRVYYFGESVLRAPYRGRGIGHAFFDEREAAARDHGFAISSFCAVVRPNDHPLRPRDHVPHDAFWSKRGYRKRDDMIAAFSWRDLGEASETTKPMVFWLKELTQ